MAYSEPTNFRLASMRCATSVNVGVAPEASTRAAMNRPAPLGVSTNALGINRDLTAVGATTALPFSSNWADPRWSELVSNDSAVNSVQNAARRLPNLAMTGVRWYVLFGRIELTESCRESGVSGAKLRKSYRLQSKLIGVVEGDQVQSYPVTNRVLLTTADACGIAQPLLRAMEAGLPANSAK